MRVAVDHDVPLRSGRLLGESDGRGGDFLPGEHVLARRHLYGGRGRIPAALQVQAELQVRVRKQTHDADHHAGDVRRYDDGGMGVDRQSGIDESHSFLRVIETGTGVRRPRFCDRVLST